MKRMKKFLTEKRQEKLLRLVWRHYQDHKFDFAHDFDHVLRVLYWVIKIGKREKADLSILIPAALLHDIALYKVSDNSHAKEGEKLCVPFLKKCGYSKEEIKRIGSVIRQHSTDDLFLGKKNREGKILYDADKLDATGPASLYRWFFEFQRLGYGSFDIPFISLQHIKRIERKFGKGGFYTRTARRIAKERLKYTKRILREIAKDLEKFKKLKGEVEKLLEKNET